MSTEVAIIDVESISDFPGLFLSESSFKGLVEKAEKFYERTPHKVYHFHRSYGEGKDAHDWDIWAADARELRGELDTS